MTLESGNSCGRGVPIFRMAMIAAGMLFWPMYVAGQTFVCPSGPGPGEIQVGTTGGSGGIAVIPICASDGSEASSEDGNSSSNAPKWADTPAGPPADPMQARVNLAISQFQLAAASFKRRADLMQDPRYQRYMNGGWEFFQGRTDAAPGEYCSALWSRKDGLVSLSGPGGDYGGALLSFWSEDIPRPNTADTISVTLTQNNEPPQSVKVFNYTSPGISYGAISFAVPSIEAALAGVEDVLRFKLSYQGKTIASIEWHDGNKARNWLRNCVSKRAKK